MRSYYAVFLPDDERITVLFPDVPGCQTWGGTEEEAFARAVEALEGHLEALAEDGDPIPEPSGKEQARQLVLEELEALDVSVSGDLVLQLVPAPDLSRTVKATMSFKEGTLEMIDRKAEALGMKRSEFVAVAARHYQPTEERG